MQYVVLQVVNTVNQEEATILLQEKNHMRCKINMWKRYIQSLAVFFKAFCTRIQVVNSGKSDWSAQVERARWTGIRAGEPIAR